MKSAETFRRQGRHKGVHFTLRPCLVSGPAAGLALASLLLLALLNGCGDVRPSRRAHEMMGPPDAARPATPVAQMEAHGMFFAGQLEAECLLAPGGLPWAARGGEGKAGKAGRREGGGSLQMGGGMKGGGMGEGRHGGGEAPPGMGDPGFDRPRSSLHASNLPPVQLRLRLTNHDSAPAVVTVLDFNSAIGNFVVQPEKITVPPGGSVEAEPMISRLGVPADEVPLTVRLLLDGRPEKQVLRLQLVSEPPHPPPPAAAAP